jgi:hypothetical protein
VRPFQEAATPDLPPSRGRRAAIDLFTRNIGLLSAVATVVIASVVLAIFIHSPGIDGSEKARFHEMVYGQAHRPFVTRSLLPFAVRTTAVILPESLHDACTSAVVETPFLRRIFVKLRWDPQYALEFAVALVLMGLALVLFRYSLLSLLQATYTAPRTFAHVSSVVAVLALPVFFSYYSHIYDFPNLALFTLCLAAMIRRRWSMYLVTFVLATVNKETSVLLVALWAVYFSRGTFGSRSTYFRLLVFQFLIWLIVRGVLIIIFARNPGGLLEFHLFDHNLGRLRPFGLSSAAAWLFIALLAGFRWSAKPLFARMGLLVVVPLMGMAVFFGFFDELRMYYEVYPFLCVLLFHSVGVIWGLPVHLVPSAQEVGV